MKVICVIALLLGACLPASAQQTTTGDSNISLTPVSLVRVRSDAARWARVREWAATGPRVMATDRRMNCYNPYIGDWKHGYPRDNDSCIGASVN